MSINFFLNGNKFYGNSCLIRKSTLVDYSEKEFMRIEKQRTFNAETNSIRIEAGEANVIVSTGDRKNGFVRLHGECNTRDIFLEWNSKKSLIKVKEFLLDFSGRLILEVFLPQKLFEYVEIITQSGDVEIKDPIQTKSLQIDTRNGSIYAEMKLVGDLLVQMNSRNGNIKFRPKNVSSDKISVNSRNGLTIIDRIPHTQGGFQLEGEISGVNGDISIGGRRR